MKRFVLISIAIFYSMATDFAAELPSDDAIRQILSDRVGKNENGVGIIVKIVTPAGEQLISHGHRREGDPRALDGDTVFEIGSVTKVFTALVLADMVQRNEAALADPVGKYLPPSLSVRTRNNRPMTLLDLATHTSGLPFMPENAPPLNDPAAAKYSPADLARYVANYQPTRDAGTQWDYSNIGYWILSEALAARAGDNFENLMNKRVIAPLGLTNTGFIVSQKMRSDAAQGHDAALKPAPSVSSLAIYSLMPAAGGLYSTANDLGKLLSAAMSLQASPLSVAIKLTLEARRPTGGSEEQALGWSIVGKGDGEIIYRDGGTFGFASSIAFDPKQRIGVVVLSNQNGSIDDIARHLLRPDSPLKTAAKTSHTEITIDPVVLDRYVGRYEIKGEGTFTVAREDNFLTIESPADWGLPKLHIHPETHRDFFAAELPLRITFQSDAGDHITGFLIYPPNGKKALSAHRQ
ncbi:MAG TPA: serine hydrolase [Candidatus Udaeobacter sp.]|jgi:CubicO group peptidase (beta-lactamase class C family)